MSGMDEKTEKTEETKTEDKKHDGFNKSYPRPSEEKYGTKYVPQTADIEGLKNRLQTASEGGVQTDEFKQAEFAVQEMLGNLKLLKKI